MELFQPIGEKNQSQQFTDVRLSRIFSVLSVPLVVNPVFTDMNRPGLRIWCGSNFCLIRSSKTIASVRPPQTMCGVRPSNLLAHNHSAAA